MKPEKTTYVFQVRDTQAAYQLIMSYLNTFKFQYTDKYSMPCYVYNDYLTAKRFFEFYFQGTQLTICVYLGSQRKPMPLDKGTMAFAVKDAYRKDLDPLLQSLSNLMMQGNNIVDPYASANYGQAVVQNTSTAFQNKSANNAETMAITSFVLAIFGAILCCFGIFYGAVLLFVEVWAAIVGFKSKNWPLSLASILICVATIIYCASAYGTL